MSLYITTQEINPLKQKIMLFICDWARREKTPIPQMEIIKGLTAQGANSYTVNHALEALLKRGYLSKTKVYGEGSKTFYKVLRTV